MKYQHVSSRSGSDPEKLRESSSRFTLKEVFAIKRKQNRYNIMTQEKANLIFETDLGQQLLSFFCTSDDQVFIRREEAAFHTNEMINTDPGEYVDTTITEWFPSEPDYEGFYKHMMEHDRFGIPHSWTDLVVLAKKYNCEIPEVVDGKLIFKTI
jgi:hypothetical protein